MKALHNIFVWSFYDISIIFVIWIQKAFIHTYGKCMCHIPCSYVHINLEMDAVFNLLSIYLFDTAIGGTETFHVRICSRSVIKP